MMGYDGWGWGFMMFFWAALFVVGTVLAVRFLKSDTTVNSETNDPLDIIKKRYAKGEITKEQFVEMKKDLSVK